MIYTTLKFAILFRELITNAKVYLTRTEGLAYFYIPCFQNAKSDSPIMQYPVMIGHDDKPMACTLYSV